MTTRRRRTLLSRLSSGALLAALTPLLAGCASAGSGSYTSLYEAGRYAEAQRAAAGVAATRPANPPAEAALIAGLSSYALRQPEEAERWLRPLLSHEDRSIAGAAAATVGLIAQSRGDDEETSALLAQAASQLSGDEAANAALHAGDAQQRLGRVEAARLSYNLGLAIVDDRRLRTLLEQRLDQTGFTVQVGAYARLANAEAHARRLVEQTSEIGVPAPRVIESTDADGRRLYLVQIGAFRSKNRADRVRASLGRKGSIIASAPIDD